MLLRSRAHRPSRVTDNGPGAREGDFEQRSLTPCPWGRQLDKGQRIALALEVEPHFAEEAKKRMAAGGGDKVSVEAKAGKGKSPLPGHAALPMAVLCSVVENVPQGFPKSRDLAARSVGLSGKTVSAAKAIRAAAPEKFEAIKQGKLTVALNLASRS